MRQHTQTRRRLIVIALGICLASAGCGGAVDFSDDAERLPAGFMTQLSMTLAPETCAIVLFAWFATATVERIDQNCADNAPPRNIADSSGRVAAGAGAFVVDSLLIDGAVAGSALPRWTAVLSSAPDVSGTGTFRALASVTASDDDGDPTGSVPTKILATLYDVDRKGKRKKAGKKQARFDKKTGGAQVLFDKLKGARDHYEVDIVVKGGKVTAGFVSYGASTTTQPSQRSVSISGRWARDGSSRAGATPLTTWAGAGVSTVGKTPSGKVPKATIVAYPEQTSRVAGSAAMFDVIGLAMQADADLNPPKQQLKKIQFTLYAVDAKGKRTKLATRTGRVAKKNGVAIVIMEGVASPAGHYEIDTKAIGGKMVGSNLSLSAIVAPAGLASRVLRSGSIAGVRVLPRVERTGPSSQPR